jgi:hypothetical protein
MLNWAVYIIRQTMAVPIALRGCIVLPSRGGWSRAPIPVVLRQSTWYHYLQVRTHPNKKKIPPRGKKN